MSPNGATTEFVVSCLVRPEAYPGTPAPVGAIETHMSWVFLAGAYVYKLKKAIRQDGIDLSTPELRRRNCIEEVRLNRRFAADVYCGVVPVTSAPDGRIEVGGSGIPVDWLVHMRRLPAARNLEAVILDGHVLAEEPAIRRVARHLARFYATAAPQSVSPPAHRARLIDGVRGDLDALRQPHYALSAAKLEALAHAELCILDRCAAAFDQRVLQGRIVDGHGDLRPEHIWLDDPPAIIDCVEFDRALRLADPADELAFLGLECERLGAPAAGGWFLETYADVTGDHPPAWLLGFYRVYRALRRAAIAARHLDDPSVADPDRFLARARQYLELVEPLPLDLACVVP